MAEGKGKTFDFVVGLRSACRAMGIQELTPEAERNISLYFQELKQWSRKINLIAKGAGETEILEKHFLDSLTLLPFLQDKETHLLDIGTGAGFPGLVCKAAHPDLRLTLIEPRLKRVAFLRHVIRTLQCSDVTVLDCRVEDEKRILSDTGFTHITSRALSDIRLFLDMSRRFVKPGVQVICMKGPKWKEELTVWQDSSRDESITLCGHEQYMLPYSGASRHLLLFAENEKNRF